MNPEKSIVELYVSAAESVDRHLKIIAETEGIQLSSKLSRARASMKLDRELDKSIHDVLETVTPGYNDEQCVGKPEYFYAEAGESRKVRDRKTKVAKALCKICPVREACLEKALSGPEKYGIWGGMTEDERESLMNSRRRRR